MARIQEKLQEHTIIPYFGLRSTTGRLVRTWDFKQRKSLVIYFFGGASCAECRDTLKAFAENYMKYRRLNAEVIAIGADSLDNLTEMARELDLPFPVLADEDLAIANKYTHIDREAGRPLPSVFAADKFGSLEEEWIAEEERDLPDQEKILSLLELFELRCPE